MASGLILSSDSHVFEPPDLWTTRIDRAFRDRAPRIERVDGVDQLVVEEHQFVSGIGLISNAGARFEAPETISSHGRFEDVHRGGYDPDQHLEDMRLDGVAGEVLYPSQGLFFPQSRKILAEILAGVPEDEQAKIVGGNTARLYRFDVAQLAQARVLSREIHGGSAARPPADLGGGAADKMITLCDGAS